ncbi:hypothetical protein, partial [Salmonella enterica]
SEKPPAMPEDIYFMRRWASPWYERLGWGYSGTYCVTPTYFTESVLCTNRVIRIIFINNSNTKNSRWVFIAEQA